MIVTHNKVRIAVLIFMAFGIGTLAYEGGTAQQCASACPNGMESFNWGICRCFAPTAAPAFEIRPMPMESQGLSGGGLHLQSNGQAGGTVWTAGFNAGGDLTGTTH